MTDYPCPEGQRLWDEWDKERKIADDCLTDEKAVIVTTANKKWVAYLDHRAACQECTRRPTKIKYDLSVRYSNLPPESTK